MQHFVEMGSGEKSARFCCMSNVICIIIRIYWGCLVESNLLY